MNKIWIVEDEKIVRVTLADDLKDAGYDVQDFDHPAKVLNELKQGCPSLLITDLKMPGMDGLQLLRKVKEINADIEVIVMTAYGTIENAVQAMKCGAFNYITKPFSKEELLILVENVQKIVSLKKENRFLKAHIKDDYDFKTFIGESESTKKLFELIRLVAEKDSTVLLTGETGSGKELITNIIHFNSRRGNRPLIKVSCAILSKDIFESELFGHVKGAFTGADKSKPGRFELADGGTLYLDDIDDIPLPLQVKLLRAIEEREVERVGSAETIPVDVRLIASTKKDLLELSRQGKFREDLYYRLNVFPIKLPPLRERRSDIITILKYYIEKYSGNKSIEITPEAKRILMDYDWPGNVRELRNVAERLVLFTRNNRIDEKIIPEEILTGRKQSPSVNTGHKSLHRILSEVEVSVIKDALAKTHYRISDAARLLDIPNSTLSSKMKKYGIH